jgi:chorismate synthase
VATSRVAPGAEGILYRRLRKPEEFRQVEELQRQIWGLEEEPSLSPGLQRAVQDNGGIVLGAFVDIYLVGFTFGFLGWDGETLYHYSHLTGVRPEYQHHGVGFHLKLAQRSEVAAYGLPEIRWNFDPLQARSAALFLRGLGARPDRYYVHYYGQISDRVHRGQETDRLRTIWRIDDPRVVERIAGARPRPEEEQARWASSTALLDSEEGPHGLRWPVAVREPSGKGAVLEIPFDLALLQEHDPDGARRWRHAVRDAFRAALDLGWTIDDFAVVRIDHERRAGYFLAPPTPAGSKPPAAGGDRPTPMNEN